MATTATSINGVVQVRKVELERPWRWLERGWRDLLANPVASLSLGAMFAVAGWLVTYGLFWLNQPYLILPLAGGFFLLGPLFATGFYEISRRHAEGNRAALSAAFEAAKRNPGQIALMGVVLLICFIAWARIASLMFMLWFGLEPPPLEDLFARTFLTAENVPFTIMGTLVGGVLASAVFAISAVSIPLLLDKPRANVITAVLTSLEACRTNVRAMALWAALIFAFTAVGIATLYLGLIVALPLIGHATWHAYEDLVKQVD